MRAIGITARGTTQIKRMDMGACYVKTVRTGKVSLKMINFVVKEV